MNLTATQRGLVEVLSRYSRPVSTKTLAADTDSTALLIQRNMARLEEKGLVKRSIDKSLGWDSQTWELIKKGRMRKADEFNLSHEIRQATKLLEEAGLIVKAEHGRRFTSRIDYTVTNEIGNCLLESVSGKEFQAFADGVAAVLRGHTDLRVDGKGRR